MEFDDCPCSGNSLDRFVRPSVMAVLAREPMGLHGYMVLQHLAGLPIFQDQLPDAAGVYRLLKSMESEGCLRSQWDDAGSGPARRVYALTETGFGCLRLWRLTLRTYARNLQQTLRFVEESVAACEAETVT